MELRDHRPGTLLALVRYDDGSAVPVRQRGAAPWRCSQHGGNAACAHVAAAVLTVAARTVLTNPAGHHTDERT